MCGRFFLAASLDDLTELLGPFEGAPPERHFNIAPGQPVTALREDGLGGRHLAPLHWGLVPAWSRGPDGRYSMFNARAETVAEKPAYRAALRYRRCLVPVSGFYEWQPARDGKKKPFAVVRHDRRPFALAGLWEHWQDGNGNELESCTIIVTAAQPHLAAIHDRMPVVLERADFDRWLDRHRQHARDVAGLLQPDGQEPLEAYPVSLAVNNPRNDFAELAEPVKPG
jgi:putative SOS response-associated peptidase YedK